MRQFAFSISFFLTFSLCAQESITINAGTDSGSFKNYTGFVLGENNMRPNPKSIDHLLKLKAHFWRSSYDGHTQILADSLNMKTTIVISDLYSRFKGGYSLSKPWLNWTEYENFVDTLITLYNKAGVAPAYWDIWNEPENTFYWSGSFDQFVECIVRTRQVAQKIDTAIKLVAPSINWYNGPFLEGLLDTLAYYNVTLDAVSWHEFGLPENFTSNVTDFKNRISLNPKWGNPEIHINEFSPQQTQQVPAFRVGWLYSFEKENINWASTACWNNNFDGTTQWDNCRGGLNGLLWYDEESPLPVYWVQRAYAEMQDGKKIFCTNSSAKTLALSGKNDALQEMRVLIGRYYSTNNGTYLPADIGKDSSNVTVNINNYPYLNNGTIPLIIQRIPKGNEIYQSTPLSEPITVFNGTANVINGSINITLNNFKDGDVYYAYLNSANILLVDKKAKKENNIRIYPNPTSSLIHISIAEQLINTKAQVYNYYGQLMMEQLISTNEFEIDLIHLPNGLYSIRSGDSVKKVIKF